MPGTRSPETPDRKIAEIRSLAEAGDWEAIEAVVRGLPQWLAALPDGQSKPVLGELLTFIEALRADVRAKTDAVGAELVRLRTGRTAAECYRETTQAADGFDLIREM